MANHRPNLENNGEEHYFLEKRRRSVRVVLNERPLEESTGSRWRWFLIGCVVVFSYWLILLVGKEKFFLPLSGVIDFLLLGEQSLI